MKTPTRLVLAVLVLLFLSYVGTYVPLSLDGKYGHENGGAGNVWQPRLLRNATNSEWKHPIFDLYLPLLLLDRAFWHASYLDHPPQLPGY